MKNIEIRNDALLADISIDKKNYPLIDPIAKIVLERLKESAMHRNTMLCGPRPLSTVLTECYNQREGILSARDKELVRAAGNDAYVNITALKCSAAEAILKDLIVAPGGLPFYVEPTPCPELDDKSERKALRKTIEQMTQSGVPEGYDDIVELARIAKDQIKDEVLDEAKERAQRMNDLIRDQCEEGGYREAIKAFIRDFVTYPYAVLEGPVYSFKEVDRWEKDKFVTEYEGVYTMRRVSPFDLYWTPDSTTTQDGTGVTVVERMSVHVLHHLLEHESFISSQVKKVIDGLSGGKVGTNWLLQNSEAKSVYGTNLLTKGGTLEVLRHYGVFSGEQLIDAKVRTGRKKDKFEKGKFYECMVTVVAGVTVQIAVSDLTGQVKRPIHTASYEDSGLGIPGKAVAQQLRDIHRAYLSALRSLMANANFVSRPITEIDITKFPEDVRKGRNGSRKEDYANLVSIYPGKVLPTLGMNKLGDYTPAIKFHSIPAHMGELMRLLQFFSDLADRVTQIPAAMHGEPVGTGANRTFRGVAMLQGNALKTMATAVMNIDTGVHAPLGEILYRYNMIYEESDAIKGDAKVVAKGASTMLEKEVRRQDISEALALVGQTGVGTPEMVGWLVSQLLDDLDIPDRILRGLLQPDTMGASPHQAMGGEQEALEAAGIPPGASEEIGGMVEEAMADTDIINQ